MPIIIALAIRSLIQMAVTLGIISLAERFALPLINRALQEIAKVFGVSDEVAQDIFTNELLIFAEEVGIGALTLRTKIPTKVAERLGFSSKGFAKRKLPESAQNKVAGAKSKTIAPESAEAILSVEVVRETITNARGIIPGFGIMYDRLVGTLGVTFLAFMAAAQWIDFGNWNSGAYQKLFQKVLEKVTFGLLKPDEDYRKSRTVSADVFDKVFNTYKLEGAVGINDPYKNQSVLFTRDTLLDLTDKLGAHLLVSKGSASTKDVLTAVTLMIVFKESGTAASVPGSPAVTTASVSTKVFVGVVSQGRLGGELTFTPRPDDLITSLADLQDAAQNNLAPFLASVPARVVYEIRVVPSILTRDGFRQTGTARQIEVGVKQDGTPKIKTVVNKFAVVRLYIATDRGTRSKITEIVLGPTDAVQFRPTTGELQALQDDIQKSIVTEDIGDIAANEGGGTLEIIPGEDALASAPLPSLAPEPLRAKLTLPEGVFVDRDRNYQTLFRIVGDELLSYNTYDDLFTELERKALAPDSGKFGRIPDRLREFGINPDAIRAEPFIADVVRKYQNKRRTVGRDVFFAGTAPAVSDTAKQATGSACGVSTLFEWYQQQGQALPSVEARSTLYQELGLGQSAFYTGTAEQNVKLLTELKRRAGCAV